MARDLKLSLVVSAVDRATRPLRRIQSAISRISRATGLNKVGTALGRVGTQIGTIGVAAAATAKKYTIALTALAAATGLLTNKHAKYGDTLAKNSERIGVTVEDLQKLRHAFDLGGIGIQQTDKALLFFTKAIGDAARGTAETKQIFDAMGISIYDVNGNIKSTRVLFDEVADAMENQPSVAKRAIAANYLFGRAGKDLTNILVLGSKRIREQGEEMNALGLITEEEAERAEDFIDAKTRLGRAIEGVVNTIGAGLLPTMTQAIDKFREWIVVMRPEIVEEYLKVLSNLGIAFNAIWEATWSAFTITQSWLASLSNAFPQLTELTGHFATIGEEVGLVTLAIGALALALSAKLLIAIAGLFGPLLGLIAALVRMAWAIGAIGVALIANPIGAIIVGIAAAIGGAAYLIWKHWDSIKDAFDTSIQYIKDKWAAFKDFFAEVRDFIGGDASQFEGQDVFGFGPGLQPAAANANVGGRINIKITGPPGTSVQDIQSDNPNVPITVDVGPAFSDTALGS